MVSYFLVLGGYRPGSGPPAQQSLGTLKKNTRFKLKKKTEKACTKEIQISFNNWILIQSN